MRMSLSASKLKDMLLALFCLPALLLPAGCDVHEFPEVPDRVPFHLRLDYDTDMTEWKHIYENGEMLEEGYGLTYDNAREYGYMRYVIRAYPILGKQRAAQDYSEEFVFTRDIAEGYNHEFTLDLAPGDYNIMVWSDLVEWSDEARYYNPENFAEVTLQGEHQGDNDYRDAFRGTNRITLVADIMERLPDTLDIAMQRPLAKYEFIATGLDDFIQQEQVRAETKSLTQPDVPNRVNLENYKAVFYYVGFMPNAYSLFTDKPVDSMTGVMFESKLNKLSETDATIGFDYVFVNGSQSTVLVQIAIYDNEGEQLSLTNPISVPLKRSHHTIMRGRFLVSETSGGVNINPEYNGDHNVQLPFW